MLTLTNLRERRDSVITCLAKRGIDAAESVDRILSLDLDRRGIQKELDDTLAQSNILSRKIGEFMKEGKREEAEAVKQETSGLKTLSVELKEKMSELEKEVHDILSHLPNTPCDLVVAGKSEEDNELVYSWGDHPDLGEHNKPHWDIAKEKDLIDFDLGAKVTGAGFPFYKGKGAKLQRGLISFFLDKADEAGYTESDARPCCCHGPVGLQSTYRVK